MALQDTDNFIVGRGTTSHKIKYKELKDSIITGGTSDTYVEVAGDNMTGNLTLGTDKIVLNTTGTIDTFYGATFNTGTLENNGALIGPVGAQGGVYYSGGNLGITSPAANKAIRIQDDIGGSTVASITCATGAATFSNGNITFNASGEITAAGAIKTTSFFNSTRTQASDGIISGNLNSTQTFKVSADGSATFGGRLDVAPNGTGTNQDYVSIYNNGSIGVRRNSGDDSVYLWSGISGTTQTSRINKDGSAEFSGSIKANGYSMASLAQL